MPTKRPAAAVVAVALTAVVAVAVNTGISTLAQAIARGPEFIPITAVAYVPYTFFGVIAGAMGWAVIRRSLQRPASLLRWLVPVVLLLSFVPDLALYLLTPVGIVPIAGLMAMHVAVAALSVSVFRRIMPVADQPLVAKPTTSAPPAVAGGRVTGAPAAE